MKASSNTKRIAKNSIYLYLRMIVVTLITFYATRVTLDILGENDFGLRNVVCGITSFAGIITTAMINASQRFLAYSLGKNDLKSFKETYSMIINVFAMFACFGVLILELVGPYVIENKLVMSPDRIYAAHVVFQLTVVSFLLNTIVVPQTSAIITYEKMDVFALITMFDAFMKLVVVFILNFISYDKLISIVALTLVVQSITTLLYFVYCRINLQGCVYIPCWNSKILRDLTSFMGWNLFGTTTNVMNVQGQSILLNIFFGPIVNAAKAIADNVHSLAQQFVNNVYMAIGPQIVKTYASGEKEQTKNLVLYGTKFAFFLMAFISLPLIFNMKYLLCLWLGDDHVSDLMVVFSDWVLIQSMVQVMDYPITQTVRATGNIRNYQVCVGVQTLMFIPICYVAFRLGAEPYVSMVILSILYAIVQIYRIWKLTTIIDVKMSNYYKMVVFPNIVVVVVSSGLIYILNVKSFDILSLFFSLLSSFFIVAVVLLLLGLSNKERKLMICYLRNNRRLK